MPYRPQPRGQARSAPIPLLEEHSQVRQGDLGEQERGASVGAAVSSGQDRRDPQQDRADEAPPKRKVGRQAHGQCQPLAVGMPAGTPERHQIPPQDTQQAVLVGAEGELPVAAGDRARGGAEEGRAGGREVQEHGAFEGPRARDPAVHGPQDEDGDREHHKPQEQAALPRRVGAIKLIFIIINSRTNLSPAGITSSRLTTAPSPSSRRSTALLERAARLGNSGGQGRRS